MDQVMAYGIGASTLRCLALATVDNPISTSKMNLQDPSTFSAYEVICFCCKVILCSIVQCINNFHEILFTCGTAMIAVRSHACIEDFFFILIVQHDFHWSRGDVGSTS